jgi:hypothetical protein
MVLVVLLLPTVFSEARTPLSVSSHNSSLVNAYNNSSLSSENSMVFLPQSSKHFQNPLAKKKKKKKKKIGKVHFNATLPRYQFLFYLVFIAVPTP